MKLIRGHAASVGIPTENPVLDSVSIQFGYLQLNAPLRCVRLDMQTIGVGLGGGKGDTARAVHRKNA